MTLPGSSLVLATCLVLVSMPVTPALAEEAGPVPALPDVVVYTSPLQGMPISGDKVPGLVQSVFTHDAGDGSVTGANGAIAARIGSVGLADSAGSTAQADVLFRGFAASPVLGTPQGLAVYQNGVRINEAFGDAVNWDLVPDVAIERIDVIGANPIYGLNALGGAVAIRMKDGFGFHGGELTGTRGAFGERGGTAQFGTRHGGLAIYAALASRSEAGWRRSSAQRLDQAYLAASLRQQDLTVDVAYTHAANVLAGQGAAPVEELALDRTLVFTGPQRNANRVDLVSLSASWAKSPTFSIQGLLYARRFGQDVENGNRTSYVRCSTAPSQLCQGDGTTPLVDAGGSPVLDPSGYSGQPLGENDREAHLASGRGASLQVVASAPVLGRSNQLTAGISFDSAAVDFASSTEVGPLDAALQVQPTGAYVSTAEGTDWAATPVRLQATHRYTGVYATDTLDLTPTLALTGGGRFNVAEIALQDRVGTALTGNSRYSHFNPIAGLAWRLRPTVTFYAGLSRNTRVPTASEIECSDPLRPCLLPSSLAGDPPNLRQVVVRTLETGFRGRIRHSDSSRTHLEWHLGVFRSDLADDIYGVATGTGSGYFRNIGSTRRRGLEAGIDLERGPWSAFASYALLQATFEDAFALPSPDNPAADANGSVTVHPGDRLPGLPRQSIKAGAAYAVGTHGTVSVSVAAAGPSYLHGDEANQGQPLGGHAVVGLAGEWRVAEHVTVTLVAHNLLDARYATYGLYADPTGVGAPGVPVVGAQSRFVTPAAPRTVIAGIRIRL